MHARGDNKTTDDDWGLTRLYILHQATKGPVSSAAIKETLERHGVQVSAGSVAQTLRGMEEKGYLSRAAGNDGRASRKYVATRSGQVAIEETKDKLRALFARLSTTDRANKGSKDFAVRSGVRSIQ